jgi:hypothetical protein
MQNLIVILIIIAALFYVGRKMFNSFRPGAASCGCGCSGCSNTGCTSMPRDAKPEDNRK